MISTVPALVGWEGAENAVSFMAELFLGLVMVAIAFLLAALFSGAALYVNVVEQPARMKLDDKSLLIEWKTAYKRGTFMQAPLALLGFLAGFAAWWFGGDGLILIAAILLIANWPYTLILIRPTNNRLMEKSPDVYDAEIRPLIKRWGRLHAVRTTLGFLATIVILLDVL